MVGHSMEELMSREQPSRKKDKHGYINPWLPALHVGYSKSSPGVPSRMLTRDACHAPAPPPFYFPSLLLPGNTYP